MRRRALDIGDDGIEGHDVREVDNHIGSRCVLELAQIEADLGHDIKNGLPGGIDNAFGGGADERAHAAVPIMTVLIKQTSSLQSIGKCSARAVCHGA